MTIEEILKKRTNIIFGLKIFSEWFKKYYKFKNN